MSSAALPTTSPFPSFLQPTARLRKLPRARESEGKIREGTCTTAKHTKVDDKKLRGILGFVCDDGAVLTLLIAVGIPKAVRSDSSTCHHHPLVHMGAVSSSAGPATAHMLLDH